MTVKLSKENKRTSFFYDEWIAISKREKNEEGKKIAREWERKREVSEYSQKISIAITRANINSKIMNSFVGSLLKNKSSGEAGAIKIEIIMAPIFDH